MLTTSKLEDSFPNSLVCPRDCIRYHIAVWTLAAK